MGGKEQECPIYISLIIPGGYADQHGGLRMGDQLVSVNGQVRSTSPRCIHLACSGNNSRSNYFLFDAHYVNTNILVTISQGHQNVLYKSKPVSKVSHIHTSDRW